MMEHYQKNQISKNSVPYKPSSLKDKNFSNQKQNPKASPLTKEQEELKVKKQNLEKNSHKPEEKISKNKQSEIPELKEYPSKVYDDYQNKNTFDQEKISKV